jgi:hypothetical protein
MPPVDWVEKVPQRKRRGKWFEITAALRTRPGQWARVATSTNTSYATMLKQGKLGDALPGEFEAESRRDDVGSYDIYARYVGDEKGITPPPPHVPSKPSSKRPHSKSARRR